MTRTALIIVAREAEGAPDGLAALLPVARRPLVEHQARRALRAGLDEVLLVTERYPAALADAIDRMRDDGLRVRVAADGAHAGQGMSPSAPVVLIADGTLPAEDAIAAVAALPAPAIATFADDAGMAAWERIDATTRWAGLARLDGDALIRTAEMLGDWDLELTLVRRQVGRAPRLPLDPRMVALVDDPPAAQAAADALAPARTRIGRALIGRVGESRVEARWLRDAGLAAGAGGVVLAAAGPAWAALGALAAAGPLDRLGRRLAQVRLDRPARDGLRARLLLAALIAALLVYGARLSGRPGFEPALLALVTVGAMVAARNQRAIAGIGGERWAPRGEWMLWAAAGPVLAGQGVWALAGLAAWATAGLFVPQWRALRPVAAPSSEAAAEIDQRLSTGT